MAQCAKIVDILEEQLAELDRLGAHVAAAHLDAAIVHLRHESTHRKEQLN